MGSVQVPPFGAAAAPPPQPPPPPPPSTLPAPSDSRLAGPSTFLRPPPVSALGAETDGPRIAVAGVGHSVPAAAKRATPACQRCRRGKVKCVTVDGVLPCQACLARGHEASCVRGEKGRAADDRLPRVRKRPAEEFDGMVASGSSSAAAHPSQRSACQTVSVGPAIRGPSLGKSGGSADSEDVRSLSPPSPMYSPQAVPTALQSVPGEYGDLRSSAMPGSDAIQGSVSVKREEAGPNEVLPPLPVLITACESFFEGYFQLGFLHRPSFLHQLQTKPESVSPFLLLGMLTISSRFVPALITKHESPTRASDFYAARAHEMVLSELVTPSLAAVQALYLLGLHDFGNRGAFRAKAMHGLARQMAAALRLHEDPPDASVIDNEVRRRTWWFLTLDAHLLNNGSYSSSKGGTDSAFDPLTVPIPLPSQEQDFTFGVPSRVVQYFPGARSVAAQQHSTVAGETSLLGALLHVRSIFGRTARALSEGGCLHSGPSDESTIVPPWQPGSLLQTTQRELQSWLATLDGTRQKWSTSNLLAYRNLHLDLGFWSCYADFHTIHLLARRAYLPQMIRALAPERRDEQTASAGAGTVPPGGRAYWATMGEEIVAHAFDLLELQEEVAAGRPTLTGITPHLSFCIYLAGSILNYLRICPWLCPARAPSSPIRIANTLEMLQQSATVWPVAERWHRALYFQAAGNLLTRAAPERTTPQVDFQLELGSSSWERPSGHSVGPGSTGGRGGSCAAAAVAALLREEASGAGKMDAASALAAMSGAGRPPPPASSVRSSSSSASSTGSRHSSAVAGLLHAAATGEAGPASPRSVGSGGSVPSAFASATAARAGAGGSHAAYGAVAQSMSSSGLYTPRREGSEGGPGDEYASSKGNALVELFRLDLGELRQFLFGDEIDLSKGVGVGIVA